MARRSREGAKGLAGHGKIPDVGMDNLLTPKQPLGPIGKIAKKGIKVSSNKSAKKFPSQGT